MGELEPMDWNFANLPSGEGATFSVGQARREPRLTNMTNKFGERENLCVQVAA